MKNIIFATLIVMMTGTNLQIPHDQIIQNQTVNGDEINMSDVVATFDLPSLEGTESQVIITESGSKAIITLEKSSDYSIYPAARALQNDTYIISYSSLTEKISYKIAVRNNLITAVHSGSYSVFGYSVNSATLKLINSKNASYILNCSFLFRSWTNTLNATITSTNELEIRFNG